MTTPMPSSSSTAPNTVIGGPIPDLSPERALAHVVHGHRELIEVIASHAAEGHTRRELKRQEAHREHLHRSHMGPIEQLEGVPVPGG